MPYSATLRYLRIRFAFQESTFTRFYVFSTLALISRVVTLSLN